MSYLYFKGTSQKTKISYSCLIEIWKKLSTFNFYSTSYNWGKLPTYSDVTWQVHFFSAVIYHGNFLRQSEGNSSDSVNGT